MYLYNIQSPMLSSLAINILEIINLTFSLLFVIAYVFRLYRLKHFALSSVYSNSYPRVRILLCAIYLFLSIVFLITSVIVNVEQHGQNLTFWLIEGIGEIIDSIILIMQSFTLRQELRKERPYTSLHLIYCIYLNIVCLVRIIIIALEISFENFQFTYLFFFYLGFQITAVLLLGYWIAKRQQLPQFDDNRRFNSDQLTNNSKLLINKNIQISYLRKISENFTYIRPSIAIEKDNFRVILQIYNLDRQISQSQRKSINQEEISSHLKVISDHTYNMTQLKELYKLCGRFSIQQKLNFQGISIYQFYKTFQLYLNQLFDNKKHYHPFILNFFQVSLEYLNKFDAQLRHTIKGSEFDMFAHLDKNAPLVSIRVFKQLWIDDHYIFYIDVIAIDGSFESRPMKRFNDFESFHSGLNNLIKKNHNGKYLVPHLPKKYLFNWDEQKITHRRLQLEKYLRGITNDYNIMLKCSDLRAYILKFLECKNIDKITCDTELKNYYIGTQIFKGDIKKCLTSNQYVTFYEFKIFQKGLLIKTISKRFSEFIYLHESICRQMHNSQIQYKFLVLPEKHLYKSDENRHQKLKGYLQNVLQIRQPWEIYAVNSFFGFGSSHTNFDQYSSILHKEDSELSRQLSQKDDIFNSHSPMLVDSNSVSSKNRMSAMIDELGF